MVFFKSGVSPSQNHAVQRSTQTSHRKSRPDELHKAFEPARFGRHVDAYKVASGKVTAQMKEAWGDYCDGRDALEKIEDKVARAESRIGELRKQQRHYSRSLEESKVKLGESLNDDQRDAILEYLRLQDRKSDLHQSTKSKPDSVRNINRMIAELDERKATLEKGGKDTAYYERKLTDAKKRRHRGDISHYTGRVTEMRALPGKLQGLRDLVAVYGQIEQNGALQASLKVPTGTKLQALLKEAKSYASWAKGLKSTEDCLAGRESFLVRLDSRRKKKVLIPDMDALHKELADSKSGLDEIEARMQQQWESLQQKLGKAPPPPNPSDAERSRAPAAASRSDSGRFRASRSAADRPDAAQSAARSVAPIAPPDTIATIDEADEDDVAQDEAEQVVAPSPQRGQPSALASGKTAQNEQSDDDSDSDTESEVVLSKEPNGAMQKPAPVPRAEEGQDEDERDDDNSSSSSTTSSTSSAVEVAEAAGKARNLPNLQQRQPAQPESTSSTETSSEASSETSDEEEETSDEEEASSTASEANVANGQQVRVPGELEATSSETDSVDESDDDSSTPSRMPPNASGKNEAPQQHRPAVGENDDEPPLAQSMQVAPTERGRLALTESEEEEDEDSIEGDLQQVVDSFKQEGEQNSEQESELGVQSVVSSAPQGVVREQEEIEDGGDVVAASIKNEAVEDESPQIETADILQPAQPVDTSWRDHAPVMVGLPTQEIADETPQTPTAPASPQLTHASVEAEEKIAETTLLPVPEQALNDLQDQEKTEVKSEAVDDSWRTRPAMPLAGKPSEEPVEPAPVAQPAGASSPKLETARGNVLGSSQSAVQSTEQDAVPVTPKREYFDPTTGLRADTKAKLVELKRRMEEGTYRPEGQAESALEAGARIAKLDGSSEKMGTELPGADLQVLAFGGESRAVMPIELKSRVEKLKGSGLHYFRSEDLSGKSGEAKFYALVPPNQSRECLVKRGDYKSYRVKEGSQSYYVLEIPQRASDRDPFPEPPPRPERSRSDDLPRDPYVERPFARSETYPGASDMPRGQQYPHPGMRRFSRNWDSTGTRVPRGPQFASAETSEPYETAYEPYGQYAPRGVPLDPNFQWRRRR